MLKTATSRLMAQAMKIEMIARDFKEKQPEAIRLLNSLGDLAEAEAQSLEKECLQRSSAARLATTYVT